MLSTIWPNVGGFFTLFFKHNIHWKTHKHDTSQTNVSYNWVTNMSSEKFNARQLVKQAV